MAPKKKNKKDSKPLKTLCSINPFSRPEHRIIDFMAKVSKNIHNSAVYCHRIYDFFYDNCYNDLFDFYKKFIPDQLENNSKNKILYDSKLLLEHVRTNLVERLCKKYNYYSENIKRINFNNDLLWQFGRKLNFDITIDIYNRDRVKHYLIAHFMSNIVAPICEDSIYMKTITGIIDYYVIKNSKIEIKQEPRSSIKKVISEFLKLSLKEHMTKKELKKVKLQSDKYVIKCFTYCNLGNNRTYLPADVCLNIIDQTYDSYLSYLALKREGKKCNRISFLDKDARYNLYYYASSRKQVKIKGKWFVRISLGEYISNNYNDISEDKGTTKIDSKLKNPKYSKIYRNANRPNVFTTKIHDGQYMYIPMPKKLSNKSLQLVNIVPMYDGQKYKVCFTYQSEKVKMEKYDEEDLKNYLFADLGMNNLFTIYDPVGKKHYIISGKEIISINKYYNSKIDEEKSKISVSGVLTSNNIRNILVRRENKLNNAFDKIAKFIVETFPEKNCLVVGYNKGWKSKINLGRKTNRNFYEIPFVKLLNKIKDKLNNKGKEFKSTNESYTSICDGLALEQIGYHENYMGKRIKRGLFSSSKHKLINADMNGAINICRKYMMKIGIEIREINEKGIYNPIHIRKL